MISSPAASAIRLLTASGVEAEPRLEDNSVQGDPAPATMSHALTEGTIELSQSKEDDDDGDDDDAAKEELKTIFSSSDLQALSKNAQKRLLKQQKWDAGKKERREIEKARKKERAVQKRKLIELGVIEKPLSKRPAGQKLYKSRIVIDCGFDDRMSEKEIKSMSSQLGLCYASNRSSETPAYLLITSLNGQLQRRMKVDLTSQHEMWKNVEWWEEGYEALWESDPGPISIGTMRGKMRAVASKEDVIYLTGDSPNVLAEIDEYKTYILGGIVDRNRYKFLCYNKAKEQGIKHARLPISEYLPEMLTRKILTVNQVYEIIIKWIEKRDWKAALASVMPERKYTDDFRAKKKAKKLTESLDQENQETSDETVGVQD